MKTKFLSSSSSSITLNWNSTLTELTLVLVEPEERPHNRLRYIRGSLYSLLALFIVSVCLCHRQIALYQSHFLLKRFNRIWDNESADNTRQNAACRTTLMVDRAELTYHFLIKFLILRYRARTRSVHHQLAWLLFYPLSQGFEIFHNQVGIL